MKRGGQVVPLGELVVLAAAVVVGHDGGGYGGHPDRMCTVVELVTRAQNVPVKIIEGNQISTLSVLEFEPT